MRKEKPLTSRSFEYNPDYFQLESGGGEMKELVLNMLKETVFGQDEACEDVARAVIRNLGGFRNPNRPEYVGMFLGQPGVGKTEMGKAIAKIYNPNDYESRLKVIDCSIFQEQYDISRITGAAPGYVGYDDDPMITPEFLLNQNVIVFDEIEKADPALHRLLLRIMDKGRLDINRVVNANDENGFDAGLDFSRSTIVLTSNIGSSEITALKSGKKPLGFGVGEKDNKNEDIRKVGKDAVLNYWRNMPEFVNRLDSIVVFKSMTTEVQHLLIDKFLEEYQEQQGLDEGSLLLTQDLKDWLVSISDLSLAGREVRRNLDAYVIARAAEVRIDLPGSVHLVADLSKTEPGKVVFWVSKTMLWNEMSPF